MDNDTKKLRAALALKDSEIRKLTDKVRRLQRELDTFKERDGPRGRVSNRSIFG